MANDAPNAEHDSTLRRVEINFAGELLGRYGPRQPIHFALYQPPINAFAMEENVRRTVLHDFTGIEHDNAIKIAHGREPMRDGDHRASVHQPAQCLADGFFRLAVQRRCGFVEQK